MELEKKFVRHNGNFLRLKNLTAFEVFEATNGVLSIRFELSLSDELPLVYDLTNIKYSKKARDFVFNEIMISLQLDAYSEIDLNRIENDCLEHLKKKEEEEVEKK